ncbi:MAG: Gfo/Idh/MocA family oxidoreductase [Acidobacteria bacterium]|nr:Gfo/Idh/MocA family oxidoreductase [Acidobacteriota bacterium]
MMSTLSVGFIGLSHLHPKSYMAVFEAVPGMKVVAASEADPAVREAFGREFPVRTYEDWRGMLDAERLDVAMLFLPHYLCPEAGVACAERGIHLLIEKPMAADSAGLKRVIAAAAKANVALSSPYVWRYHPVALAMKRYDHSKRHHWRDRRRGRPVRSWQIEPLHRRSFAVDVAKGAVRRRTDVQPRRALDRSVSLAAR